MIKQSILLLDLLQSLFGKKDRIMIYLYMEIEFGNEEEEVDVDRISVAIELLYFVGQLDSVFGDLVEVELGDIIVD